MNMETQSIHKTYKYKLKPTPEQERMLDRTLMLCRHIYNAALGERREAYRMRGVSVNYYHQKAELPGIKEAMPEYGAVYSQVLQDVVLRVDHAFQAFFRRVQSGETPGYPRFQGRARFNSITYPQYDNGTTLDNGLLVLSKIGRIAVRWSRPIEGTPKTVTISREVDGWYVCISCADVPVEPLSRTGQESGIDVGLRIVRDVGRWHDDSQPALLPQGGTSSENRTAHSSPPQEGRHAETQGGYLAGESASPCASATPRFSL